MVIFIHLRLLRFSSPHKLKDQTLTATMAPSAIDDSAMQIDSDEPTYSPPTTYPVRENKFDKPMEDQSGGREVASQQPADSVAIVIDNGWRIPNLGYALRLAFTDC